MKYQVTMGFRVSVGSGADPARVLEAHLDAAQLSDAVKAASTLIRTAIHAAQGSTPGWPTFTELEAHAAVVDQTDPLASANA